jgi:hypothetical protein
MKKSGRIGGRVNMTQMWVDRVRLPHDYPYPSATWWDLNLPGLGLRASKFRKSWIAAYTVKTAGGKGKPVQETLGTTKLIPKYADAKELARSAILKARAGVNQVEERRQELAKIEAEAEQAKAKAALDAVTFRTLAEAFIERHVIPNNKPGTQREVERVLQKAAAFFGSKPARDIDKADIAAFIEVRSPKALKSRKGGRAEANNKLIIVRRCLRWALDEINPETR